MHTLMQENRQITLDDTGNHHHSGRHEDPREFIGRNASLYALILCPVCVSHMLTSVLLIQSFTNTYPPYTCT